jgi:hypothetical protein
LNQNPSEERISLYFQDNNKLSIKEIIQDRKQSNPRQSHFMNSLNKAILDHEENRFKRSNVGFHRAKDFISRNIELATSATHDGIQDSTKQYFT